MFETLSHRVITVWGIQLRIDLTFYILGLLLMAAPLVWGHDLPLRFVWPICLSVGEYVLFVAFSVLIHEAGHAVCAKMLKHDVHTIVIHALGGWTHVETLTDPPRYADIPIFLSGPAVTLVAGCIFAFAGCKELATLNLGLGLANIVPAWPLDGGRVCQALIFHWVKSEALAIRLLRWLSRMTYTLLLLAFHDWITLPVILLFWLIAEFFLRRPKTQVTTT